jgi:hypothetical protein
MSALRIETGGSPHLEATAALDEQNSPGRVAETLFQKERQCRDLRAGRIEPPYAFRRDPRKRFGRTRRRRTRTKELFRNDLFGAIGQPGEELVPSAVGLEPEPFELTLQSRKPLAKARAKIFRRGGGGSLAVRHCTGIIGAVLEFSQTA